MPGVSVRIVGLGGSVDAASQSERALLGVLRRAEERGAQVQAFVGTAIDFPPYHTGATLPVRAEPYLEALRAADAVVISSPGYHGTVSGLVKNALDYLEELRHDRRPYLEGRPVGVLAVARGWQAGVGTLTTLRQVVHALRGWPTPLGLVVNSALTVFDEHGGTDDESVTSAMSILVDQLLGNPWQRRSQT